MDDTHFFRSLEEIPSSLIEKYEHNNSLAMRGFDDRAKISDLPYDVKSPLIRGFVSNEIKKKFLEMNEKLNELNVPFENRIFLICGRCWFDPDVTFSGHSHFHDGVIDIDILNGNRPSGKDWTPNHSFHIRVINNRPIFSGIDMGNYHDYIIDICRTLMSFYDNSYIDFTLLKSGHFVYHDLSIH